jgi:hypothetical protein
MKGKARLSRESGNPGNLKKTKRDEKKQHFPVMHPAWMPAFATMKD